MVSDVIWVAIYARPRREVPLRPLMEERFRVGADLMYTRRFQKAIALQVGDRKLSFFGGPSGSNPDAQHLVYAGCVTQKARPLEQADLKDYPELFRLTIEMFPHFQTAPGLLERQGIIKYQLFRPPPGVMPLPRPFQQPRPGDNFKRFVPSDPEYPQLDDWWHAVVPRGQCGNE